MTQAPWDLVVAINASLETHSWLEQPEGEVPPETYWHSPEHIKDWFASVRQRRKDQASGMASIEPDEGTGDDYSDPDVASLR